MILKAIAISMAPENHILAAVVRFNTLFDFLRILDSVLPSSSPLSITTAPRNLIPLTFCAEILEVKFESTETERNIKIIEPPITRE